MHRSNLRKYRAAFSFVDLLNICESAFGSFRHISPHRGFDWMCESLQDGGQRMLARSGSKKLVPSLAKTLLNAPRIVWYTMYYESSANTFPSS